MAGPWEKYSAGAKPWERYQTGTPEPGPVDGAGEARRGGFMPYVNQGIASTLGAPVDLLNAGLGAIGVPVSDEPFLGSRSIARGMGLAGAEPAPIGQEPEALGEYVGQGLGGAAGFLLPGAAALRGASAVGGSVARGVAEDVARPFVLTPKRALASEALAGAGAGAGMHAAEQIAPDSAGASVAGALAGALLGGVAPGAAVMAARNMPGISLAERMIRTELAPFTESGALERARARVHGLVENREAALDALNAPREANLSPAVRTGDPRLMGLESSVRQQNPSLDAAMREAENAASAGLAGDARALGGDVSGARNYFNERIGAILDRTAGRTAAADERAATALDAIQPSMSKEQASMALRGELDNALREARAQESALWNQVPRDAVVETGTTKGAYQDILSDLPRAKADDVPDIARRFLGVGNEGMRASETAHEMHGLYSALRREARFARAGDTPNYNKARISDRLADAILEDMGRNAEVGGPLNEALAFSREMAERFSRGSVGRVMGSERTGGSRVADALTMDTTVGRPGTQGAVAYDEVSGALGGMTPGAEDAISEYLRRQFVDSAVRDGSVRPSSGQAFMRNRGDVLGRTPQTYGPLAEALEASERAQATAGAMKRRATAVDRGATGRVVTDAKRGQEFRAIMQADDPQSTAAQLARQARKDQSGEALAGLKGSVLDDLIGGARTGQFDENNVSILSGRAIKAKLADDRYAAAAREILSPEEMSRLDRIADELVLLETSRKAGTASGPIMGDQPNSAVAYIARVLAARSGARLGQGTSGASLQTASMASNRMQRVLLRLTNDKAEQLITRAVAGDKELFEALLQPMSSTTETQRLRVIEAVTGLLGEEIADQ